MTELSDIEKQTIRDSLEVLLNESVNMIRDRAIEVTQRNGRYHPYSREMHAEAVRVSAAMESDMNAILEKLNIQPRFNVFPGIFAIIRPKGD